jgi:hypothetical protein
LTKKHKFGYNNSIVNKKELKMEHYANEVNFVINTNNGIESVYITARSDYRSEKVLAVEIPKYFGPEFVFVRKLVIEDGLTKEEAELGRKALLAYYEAMGRNILNVKDSPMLMVAV